MPLNMAFLNQSGGIELSLSDGSSSIQRKIEVAQQVLTVLEDTMSTAKSMHLRKQSLYQSKINELEEQIQRLKQEMTREEDDFNSTSKSLEDGFQKYLNLENKLITIKERSSEDYVALPELCASTDMHVAQYLEHRYNDWQRLKYQCQDLNQSTHNSFRNHVFVRKYLVSVQSNAEYEERYKKAMDKANALNLFRGKKYISRTSQPTNRLVYLTCYKTEAASQHYIHSNYIQIIEQVLKEQSEEFRGRHIDINEISPITEEQESNVSGPEITIHVQPNTSSTLNPNYMPRQITIYQFPEEAVATIPTPPQLTTFNFETAPNFIEQGSGGGVYEFSGSESEEPIESFVHPTEESYSHSNKEMIQTSENADEANNSALPKAKRTPRKKSTKAVDSVDVLSLIGFVEDPEEQSLLPQPGTSAAALSSGSRSTTQDQSCSALKPASGMEIARSTSSSTAINDRRFLEENLYSVNPFESDKMGLKDWVLDYIQEQGITALTDVQEQAIQCFKTPGDVLYEGVANGGKTTGMAIGLLNCLDPQNSNIQALIITTDARTAKRVQRATTFNGDQYKILSQRVDELIEDRCASSSKTGKKPACQILVGTLDEVQEIVPKNLLRKDDIRFLILHKTDEIFGLQSSTRKLADYSLKRVIYALNAAIKVVVLCKNKTLGDKCPEFEQFCMTKLRQKQVLKEDMDMERFNNRRRNLSGSSKLSSASEDPAMEASNNRLRNMSGSSSSKLSIASEDSSVGKLRPVGKAKRRSTVLSSSAPSTTSENEIDVDRESVHSVVSVVTNDTNDTNSEAGNQEPQRPKGRTLISKEAMQILGISANLKAAPGAKKEPQRFRIEHMYAHLSYLNDEQIDDGKIDVIVQLDLEEEKSIVFCSDPSRAEWVGTKLRQNRLWPQVLHEDVSLKDQKTILQSYSQGIYKVLICTDFIMSVSLDSADVVLNFDFPKSAMLYASRAAFAARNVQKWESGKSTAKAMKGVVVNLILTDLEYDTMKSYEKSLGITINNCDDN